MRLQPFIRCSTLGLPLANATATTISETFKKISSITISGFRVAVRAMRLKAKPTREPS